MAATPRIQELDLSTIDDDFIDGTTVVTTHQIAPGLTVTYDALSNAPVASTSVLPVNKDGTVATNAVYQAVRNALPDPDQNDRIMEVVTNSFPRGTFNSKKFPLGSAAYVDGAVYVREESLKISGPTWKSTKLACANTYYAIFMEKHRALELLARTQDPATFTDAQKTIAMPAPTSEIGFDMLALAWMQFNADRTPVAPPGAGAAGGDPVTCLEHCALYTTQKSNLTQAKASASNVDSQTEVDADPANELDLATMNARFGFAAGDVNGSGATSTTASLLSRASAYASNPFNGWKHHKAGVDAMRAELAAAAEDARDVAMGPVMADEGFSIPTTHTLTDEGVSRKSQATCFRHQAERILAEQATLAQPVVMPAQV